MAIARRDFGKTGLQVSALGFGAGLIGDAAMSEAEAGALLNGVLDLGITLIDTARGYGLSEARIGRHLAQRRHEFVLSTKVGYGVEGVPDWTYASVVRGVEAALGRLQTDYLDIVHLHSCPAETLRAGDVAAALAACVQAGKVRVAAYSGDNEPLALAIGSGRFASIETSLNLCDQRVMDELLPEAKRRGLGVIAKRPLANAPWRFAERPEAPDLAAYWDRWQTMGLMTGLPPAELALRFAAFTWGVDGCIVGSTKLANVRANAEAIAKGKLEDDLIGMLRATFRRHDRDWVGVI